MIYLLILMFICGILFIFQEPKKDFTEDILDELQFELKLLKDLDFHKQRRRFKFKN